MLQETGKNATMKYRVPLDGSAARKMAALLDGRIPEPAAFDLRLMPDRVEQSFELGGLTGYRAAMAAFSVREMLAALCLLCRDVLEHPILMNEELELLAVDRLYWDADGLRWRRLVTLGKSEAWAALPARTPEEIWSALFTAAMETSAEKSDVLRSIVDEMEGREFSVELLSGALRDAVEKCGKNVSVPAEEVEEEYRPWETAAVPDSEVELGMTGAPMMPRAKDAAEVPAPEEPSAGEAAAPPEETIPREVPPEITPVRPVIPGVEPPQPPPRRANPLNPPGTEVVTVVAPGGSETVVLDERKDRGETSPPQTPIGKVEVKRQKIPRVVRMETNEKAYVDRARFVIGSKPGVSDFIVAGNSVISRRHAAIVTRGDNFYIIDLGSRNGVFVDKKRIPPNQETPICVGDVFVLANEKFRLEW